MSTLLAAPVSAHPRTVPGMFNPWRRLRALTHVQLEWHDDGPMGESDFERGTISLRRGLSQAERRCTVLHEALHHERGPALSTLVEREEQRVDKECARLLLPDVHWVGEALAWARDLEEAADELWVDHDTLLTRLENLHPSELHYLRRRLEHHDHGQGHRCG